MSKKNKDELRAYSNRKARAFMLVGIFTLLDLILFGVFGHSGKIVTNFLVGVFGYAIYGYGISILLMNVIVLFNGKIKIPGKIVLYYLLILLIVISMCHLATTVDYVKIGYGNYVSYAYSTHSTIGGAIGSALLYPLGKMYIFSMILLALVLVGFVALAIISQLNRELSFKVRTHSRKIKTYSPTLANNVEEIPANSESLAVLGNLDINGKTLSNNSKKGAKSATDFNYIPLQEVKDEQDIDDDLNIERVDPLSIDPSALDDEINLAKKRAEQFNSTPFFNATMLDETKNQEETVQAESKPTVKRELDNFDRLYTNNYRKKMIEEAEKKKKESQGLSNFEEEVQETIRQNELEQEENTVDPFMDILNKPIEKSDLDDGFFKDNEIPNASSIKINTVDDYINRDEFASTEKIEVKQDEPSIKEPLVEEQPVEKPAPIVVPVIKAEPVKQEVQQVSVVEEPKKAEPVQAPAKKVEKPHVYKKYVRPDIDLLEDYEEQVDVDSELLKMQQERLVETLSNFKIAVDIVGVVIGPTFYRIDFKLAPGITINKVTQREDDIAMGLEVRNLRLLAPVPGKSYCGVEIPNKRRGKVPLKSVILSEAFDVTNKKKKSGINLALGKDIDGNVYAPNLTKFPHLLMAGASGAGKSVGLNCIICGLLFKYSPEDLRMILVDPKQVEFETYSNLPHLLIPKIITNAQETINALKWVVDEMEKRYTLLKEFKVKQLDEYNELPFVKEDKSKHLPYILVVIDEFGDIVADEVGKQLFVYVQRLAAKARASGIHLILATQRPSVDVVTGTIKTNFPARIAFACSSAVDSMTILNKGGAEKLLRFGDMLFFDPTLGDTPRIQCALIDTDEINAVVEQVSSRNEGYFDTSILEQVEAKPEPDPTDCPPTSNGDSGSKEIAVDQMYWDCLVTCIETNKVSASNLQAVMAIGYPKAARIVNWIKKNKYAEETGKNSFVFNVTLDDVAKLRNGEEL